MRLLESTVSGGVLGGVALSVAVQITAVTLVAALVAHTLLRRRAAARHAVWLTALIWALLSPAVAGIAARTGLALVKFTLPRESPAAAETLPAPHVEEPVALVSSPDPSPPQPEERRAHKDEPLPSATEQGPTPHVAPTAAPPPRVDAAYEASAAAKDRSVIGSVAATLPWVWGAGTLLGISLIGAGWWRLNALRRTARPFDAVRYRDVLITIRDALGMSTLPEIATSPAAVGPAALGLFRPLVVLPEWLPESLTPRELRDVLVHECAHLLRHDPWVGLLQRLVAALFWPHPLIHFLNAQLARAREEVCDNHVLRTADACGYARTLLALTERCRPRERLSPGIGLLGRRWTLAERVSGLLDPRRTTVTRTSLVPTTLVAAGLAAIGLISAGTHFAPSVQAQDRAAAPQAPAQQIANVDAERVVRGVVLEKDPSGPRPSPEAGVVVVVRGYRADVVTPADAEGRFQLEGPEATFTLYARSADGEFAGFATADAKATEVKVHIAKATRVSGRVVDAAGRPQPGRRVQFDLGAGPDELMTAPLRLRRMTDEQGRYEFDGAVVGASGEIVVHIEPGDRPGGFVAVEKFKVRGEDAVEIPDIRVKAASPSEPPKPAAAVKPGTAHWVPAGPSRAAVEDLIRAIGRDAVTPALVDQVALQFRQQVLWAHDFERTRKLATDPDFVGRLDTVSARLGERPMGTSSLIRRAAGYQVGCDDQALASLIRRDLAARESPSRTIEGTIFDERTDRPVAGARVFSNDAIVRSDGQGHFALQTHTLRSTIGGTATFWIEADGFALREVNTDVENGVKQTIKLQPEVAFEGQVLDPDGRPVAGADVRASVDRNAVIHTAVKPRRGGNVVPLQVRTDAEGRFSVQGVPASERPVHVEVVHPAYQRAQITQAAPTTSESALVIRLERGCVVTGVVVDERGRPVSGARVEVRTPQSLSDEQTAHTEADGRFRFENVQPGRWDILVEPERHAPVFAPIVADPSRPVENQFVVMPGAYIRGKVVGPDNEPVVRASVGWMESVAGDFPGLNRMTATDADGAFRIGPLPPGKFRLTGLVESPRRLGKAEANANQTDLLIRLKPDPINR